MAGDRHMSDMAVWYCVHIPRSRTFEALNRTFLAILRVENPIAWGTEFAVYGSPANDGDGVCYFFSPLAAKHFKNLIAMWHGFPFHEPPHLKFMKPII